MKRILVPTDFSQPSMASFRFALDLASKANAEVFVIHMVELPLLPETTFGIQPYSSDPELLKDIERKAAEAFKKMGNEYGSKVPVSFKTIHDYVVPGIRQFIEKNNIDQVVMSTLGASGIDEFFIGSTAEKIARLSPVPVISIPKEISFRTIKSIVFPNTLELDQAGLVLDLKELQLLCNARLHVLLINTPEKFYSDAQAKKELDKFAKHYGLLDFTLNFRNHQSVRTGILEFINEINGDMIAMATEGRTGLAHFFKGSVAETVLNRVDHPIWTRKQKK